jgi:3-(methylthio)propanoyl-CoA dehydrogenase
MSEYVAPVRDMMFVLTELAGLQEIAALPGLVDLSEDLAAEILAQNARFSAEVLSPLNRSGDREGARLEAAGVRTPDGFREAYRQYVEAGWASLQFPQDYGGQGLPKLVAAPVMEMWKSANLAFSLCPLLTAGAVEALLLRGTEAQKALFVPPLVEGRWAGTMNLTEPQAGSDLSLIRTRAVRDGAHYRLFGQKIFITYGDHDLTENIIHLVLARLPDAPPGVRGISLFLVPKRLVNGDGSLGAVNDLRCVSLEHKLGIHASPTAVMQYGEGEGAIGYLVGEENRGLEIMFIMMNEARFAVGLEGLAIGERAYQRALAYAKSRVQSRDLAGGADAVPIIRHPDVRRMLMTMKAGVEAMRALAYGVAALIDKAHHASDPGAREQFQARAELLVPVVKGWCTELGVELTSVGIQVHGGMGYIEETGAAQHLRDARITPIYEGTTGIQANDLLGRKILRDGGRALRAVLQEVALAAQALAPVDLGEEGAIGQGLGKACSALGQTLDWVLAHAGKDPQAVYAGAVPLLKMVGLVLGGWQMARAAAAAARRLADADADRDFLRSKIMTARFFAEHFLVQVPALQETVTRGGAAVMAVAEEQF